MKLSVSAYRAQASAHKKILSNYQHQLSYGATNQATSARTPSDPAAVLPGLKVSEASFSLSCVFSQLFPKVDRAENVEAQGGGLAPPSSGYHCSAASGSRMGPGPDSGSSAPSSVPHSLATSRDEEDDDDEESSGRRSNGHGGSSFRQQQAAEADRRRDLHVGQRRKIAEIPQKCLPNQPRELRQFLSVIDSSSANVFHCRGSSVAVGGSFQRGASLLSKSFSGSGLGAGSSGGSLGFPASTTSNSLDSACADSSEIPAAARRPRSTRGSQKWSNVRAVMALYSSLRKIKRTKSNQRWMKLRTTVQLSSAISTIQKKPPLKREDSFLKRFSTRQIPESQETIDTGEGEGDQSDDKNSSRRRRRPRRPQKPPKTVVNPDENFYYYWLMLLSACVLYNLWTLIVRQSMPELQEMAPALWLSCDGFTDLVFFLDVGVQFRTGYLEQGLMVYNSKKLAGHYFKSKSFILDLLALLPLDLLQVNLGSNPMLRFPRFLKVYRVYNYYYMVESRTVYPNLWRVLNLIHILLILAHWFGCFYYLLSEAEGFHGDWVYPYRPGEYATLTRKYLGSLYWSTLTLTTIGDLPTPETNAEYVFTIVSYLIGVFIFATIVGQVGNVITNRNANRLEFERLLDGAKTYMRHHKVPGGMKRRVLRWYDYSWSRGRIQGGGDINTALGLLPDKLKTELALHVNLSVLKKVTIFQECQPEFLHDLVLKMKAYIFTPGDSICRKGEVAREMFIIADGILEVISETGRVLTTMKAGDFFGEIGILNLDGLNKRTADVRSVGYSELFSLSREDVLAALKDYPEAQEILQKLGEKRLREAQRVARSFRHPPSPGHDSSDNSTGKRIVDKLKSDVKGLKNVLRKSRRNTRPEESLELQPLTSKAPQLRRQTRIDESQDVCTSASEPPVSPLGAGLPLLARLRLLKEKQEREERRNLMETSNQITEQVQTTVEMQNPSSSSSSANVTVPLLQRLLHMKSKAEPDPVIDREAIVAKEPLLPRSVIPEESEIFISSEQNDVKATCTTTTTMLIRSPTSTSDVESNGASRKPWAMLKDASIKTGGQDSMGRVNHRALPPRTSPARKLQIRHSLVHLRQKKTKMYASVDDLSPEYCGLPFVKKLKILNERQKLAELEKVVRSSSLDCGENAEAEFDGNLTRSHSEACAIEYARKLAKLNKLGSGVIFTRKASQLWVMDFTQTAPDAFKINSITTLPDASPERRRRTLTSPDQLSPENETLERRNLKSILKKLSAGSRAGSSETSATSTPDREAATAELRKLMRAPTLEGYAARHSKLSKSVTFNKYTLQSPPGNEPVQSTALAPLAQAQLPSSSSSSSQQLAHEQQQQQLLGQEAGNDALDQQPLPPPATPASKLTFRPLGSAGAVVASQLFGSKPREDECMGELVSGIRDVIQSRLENIQSRFERHFSSLELEIRKRDEIISQLQARILELEQPGGRLNEEEDSLGDSTEHDASLEDDFVDDNEDHPFMRDSSVDTVLTARPRRRHSSPSSTTDSSAAHNRRSWEEHSEEETLELQDLPRSITPQSLWKDDVVIDLESSDESGDELGRPGRSGLPAALAGSLSDEDDEDEQVVEVLDENGHNNWEVAMLAQELEKRRRSSECSSPGS
ncbi:uncharacterized protein LOC100118446 isoform X3 [Nasonia vitripennis]|uniref:Cyclic nucleotide-binding domain-containing protein n=1 Tax=Nasonia vitripennis TaxID=7425 RepID=A0A7M7Q6V3_NASVI|nr:uncharacterized protein LOC100118446 isoform X3 [Nasonia vitripennis]